MPRREVGSHGLKHLPYRDVDLLRFDTTGPTLHNNVEHNQRTSEGTTRSIGLVIVSLQVRN